MSYRIKRAIGYGMTIKQLEEVSLIRKKDFHLTDEINEIFDNWDKPLEVPKEEYPNCFFRDVLCASLKNKTDPSSLFINVRTPDEVIGVLFMPDGYSKKEWYKFDGDIDYQFERWRNGTTRNDVGEPRDFFTEIPYGHYPYTNDLMLADGTPEPWNSYTRIKDREDIFPRPPETIQYYLQEMKILDKKGVLKLRPYIAQWWC